MADEAPKDRGRLPTAMRRWAYRLQAFLHTRGLGSARTPHPWLTTVRGVPMYVYPGTFEAVAYCCEPYEPYTAELFEQAIQPTATVLDLGAQFGYFALLAARRTGRAGCVYAFEPAPPNVELLQRNIRLNRCAEIIHVVPKAVGDQHASQDLFVYRGSDSHGLHRHPQVAVREIVSVECVTVDAVLAGQGVDVIKMDIEGHEPYALAGMSRTLAHSGRVILFTELAPAYLRRAGVEPLDYLTQLTRLGFEIQLIEERSRRLIPLTAVFPLPEDPRWHANLYCTRRG